MKLKMQKIFCLFILFLFVACSSGGGNENNGEDNKNPNVEVETNGKSVDELLADAVNALKKDQPDEAVAYYDAAYEVDNDNVKAIIYSVLANLAKISTDPKTVSLMKEHFGFKEYPNRLNALIFSSDWLTEVSDAPEFYYDYNFDEYLEWFVAGNIVYGHSSETTIDKTGYYYYDYDSDSYKFATSEPNIDEDNTFLAPKIKTPNWVKGEGSMYNNFLLGGNIIGWDNWVLSLVANMIDKNSKGFNTFIDDVIGSAFDGSFKVAEERLKKLENRKEDRISLDPYFIEKLDMEDVFDGSDQIGWAEVNAVLSAMLAVKASLEYVASYDLNTDLNWLKTPLFSGEDEDLRKHFFAQSAGNFPFNNNFLKARSGKINTSKATYVKAIKGIQASYSAIRESKLYSDKVKESYSVINSGLDKLTEAINNGGKFYIPEDDPTKISAWPTNANSAAATINFGLLFKEGYFAIDKIFKTNNGKPVFSCYVKERGGNHDEYFVELDKSNYKEILATGCRLNLSVDINYLTAVFDITEEDDIEYVDIAFSRDDAIKLFEKYYP